MLRHLASVDKETWQRLIQAIGTSNDLISSRQFIDAIRSEGVSDELDPEQFLGTITSLHALHASHGWSLEAIAQSISEDGSLKLPKGKQRQLQERLLALLMEQPLAGLARAFDVITSHARVFHTARCFTDLRPVFGEDPDEPPVGGVIVQTLSIEYYDEAHELRTFHIALSERDVSVLQKALERATSKATNLRNIMRRAKLPQFDTEEEAE